MITLDMNLLKDPTIYEQNRLPHHADFVAYASAEEVANKLPSHAVKRHLEVCVCGKSGECIAGF